MMKKTTKIHLIALSIMISATSQAQHKLKPVRVFGGDEKSSLFNGVIATSKKESSQIQSDGNHSVGDAVGNIVGVNSTGFSPASTRPIIRGLEGERIRVLIDELGTLDVSGTSADHVVPISPLSIETIEVVKGPIALLYGSSAIGGVVNIVTSRHHDERFEGLSGSIGTQFQSVNNLGNLTAKVDYGTADWVFHFDGNLASHGNLKVPTTENEIENSQGEQNSITLSASKFYNKSDFFRTSFTHYNNKYGVVAEEDVTIDTNQNRIDFFTRNKLQSHVFESFSTKTAVSTYEHTEFEGTDVGTVFEKNGVESRIEFDQKDSKFLDGILGVHFKASDLEVNGDEAFLPSSTDLNIAALSYEEITLDENLKISFGSRFEFVNINPDNNGPFSAASDKDYFLANGSVGVSYKVNSKVSTSVNLSFNQRNPNAQELFSNGAHIAIGIFENGDSNLSKESAAGIEFITNYKSKILSSSLNIFANRFSNYIALNNTGVQDDTDESGTAGDSPEDFFIFDYISTDALIYGAEFTLEAPLTTRTSILTQADFLIGEDLSSDENLPRITPPRVSVRLNHKINKWDTHVEARHNFKATQTALNETQTDSYTLINAGISRNFKYNDSSNLRTYFQANNIFDQEARNHASFTKNVMQLGGANFIIGLEASF